MKAKKIETFEEGYAASIKKLSVKDCTRQEILSYLVKRELDEEIAQAVVKRLLELNYVNDERLCKNICAYMANENFSSKKAIKYKLLKKGIDKELIYEQMAELEVDEYKNAAKIFFIYMKKQRRKDEKTKLKVMRHLASKGFSYGVIDKTIKENQDML